MFDGQWLALGVCLVYSFCEKGVVCLFDKEYQSGREANMFLERFLPQSVPFFELLIQQNDMLQEISRQLVPIVEKKDDPEESLKRISVLEEDADVLNRKITWHLSQTFITPIDREDIHSLNLAQERVADALQNLAARFFASSVTQPPFPARMMVQNLVGMVQDTVPMLDALSKKQEFSHDLDRLKNRKSDCGMLFAGGLAELQEMPLNSFDTVRELILWSQLYERIEMVVELVSDLADTLEQVVLKYV